jgi:hypothetical protein
MGADFGPRFLFLVFVQLRFNLTLNHLAFLRLSGRTDVLLILRGQSWPQSIAMRPFLRRLGVQYPSALRVRR